MIDHPDILIVDDSSTARKVIAKATAVDGAIYREAGDGHEAMTAINERTPDLIITDLVMPGFDGLRLVKECTALIPQVPVILVTSFGSEETAFKALHEGAASYVPKGLLDDNLHDIARRLLDHSTQLRAKERLYGHLQRTELVFDLANDLTVIGPLIRQVHEALEWMGTCHEGDSKRVAVALDEALINAIVHGNLEVSSELRDGDSKLFYDEVRRRKELEPYCDRTVKLHARITPDVAEFVIQDDGPGFDHHSLPDPRDPENLAKPSGRGVLLMRVFMDEVEFNDAGNRVTLRKKRCPDEADE